MEFIHYYESPIGRVLLSADEAGLTGLWFCGQKYYASGLSAQVQEKPNEHILEAVNWLDIYFTGNEPGFMPMLHPKGSPFQMQVWEILKTIPYGQTTTYGTIGKQIAEINGIQSMSAQAVGGAVGHNPISIIIPCHRVIASNGQLTGYAGGINKKNYLLELEKTGI